MTKEKLTQLREKAAIEAGFTRGELWGVAMKFHSDMFDWRAIALVSVVLNLWLVLG